MPAARGSPAGYGFLPARAPIAVETSAAASVDQVRRAYRMPAEIVKSNAASDDWRTTRATVDLREGGALSSRIEAKDGSKGFDCAGAYTKIVAHKRIEYATSRVQEVADLKGVVTPSNCSKTRSYDVRSLRVTLRSEPRDPTLTVHPIVNFGLAREARDFSRFCAWVLSDNRPVAL